MLCYGKKDCDSICTELSSTLVSSTSLNYVLNCLRTQFYHYFIYWCWQIIIFCQNYVTVCTYIKTNNHFSGQKMPFHFSTTGSWSVPKVFEGICFCSSYSSSLMSLLGLDKDRELETYWQTCCCCHRQKDWQPQEPLQKVPEQQNYMSSESTWKNGYSMIWLTSASYSDISVWHSWKMSGWEWVELE